MRIRGALLTLFVIASVVGVVGAALADTRLEYQATVVALVALTVFASVASRGAPGLVRGPLLAALAVLTIAEAVRLVTYEPHRIADLQARTELITKVVDESPRAMLRWRLSKVAEALPALLAYAGIAVAVAALPTRRRRLVLGLAAAAVAPLIVGYAVVDLWDYDIDVLSTLAYAGSVPLVLSLVAVGILLGTQRGRPGLLAAGGIVLMTLPVLLFEGPTQAAGVRWTHEDAWLHRDPESTDSWTIALGYAEPSMVMNGVLAGLALAGLALVVLACLRVVPRSPS